MIRFHRFLLCALFVALTLSVTSANAALLSTLIDTMDAVARPERQAEPCDGRSLAALRAQLALPAQAGFVSRFSLRN